MTLSSNAGASTTQWNFAADPGTRGASQSYLGVTSNGSGPAVTAYGYQITNATSSAHDLYGKLGGGDENGLGLNSFVDSEIDNMSLNGHSQVGFIQLDLSNVMTAFGATGSVTVNLGSVTGSDAYVLSASSTPGQIGTEIVSGGATPSGVATQVVSLGQFSLTDRYMTISATTGSSVLLNGLQYGGISSNIITPEPTALAVFILGGMTLLLMPRKKPTVA